MSEVYSQDTAIDLFSGCGGLTQGLKTAGLRVVGAVELDEKARAVFSENHPEVPLIGKDILDADPLAIMRTLAIAEGQLGLLAGCPPCQSFSRIRRRNKRGARRDTRNALIDRFADFVEAMKPRLLMLENVPDLVRYWRFRRFCRRLRLAGYFLQWNVLDVSDFGVPQRRKRLILIGSQSKNPKFAVPILSRVTVRQTIGNLPPAGFSGDDLHDFPERRSNRMKLIISAIPRDGGSRASLPDALRPTCHKTYKGFNDVFGRLSWDSVAPTITSGCTNPSKGRFLHPVENRAITLREAALLQGFPQTYRFNTQHGKEAIARMIGNALPPPFICKQVLALINSSKLN